MQVTIHKIQPEVPK